MVSYFSCAFLQTWRRPITQHSWGSEVAALLAACSSALFTVAKTLTRAKFLDDAGQLGFQGVQVGTAVKKHRNCTHDFHKFIFMFLSHFTRNLFISRIFVVKKKFRHSYFILQTTMKHYNQV